MKQVWKYPITARAGELATVAMVKGAEIIAAQQQHSYPMLWVIADTDEQKKEMRRFIVLGTGWDLPPELKLSHIATFQDGPFVWHIFESKADQ